MKNKFFSLKIDRATLGLLTVAIIAAIATYLQTKYDLDKEFLSIVGIIVVPIMAFILLRKQN